MRPDDTFHTLDSAAQWLDVICGALADLPGNIHDEPDTPFDVAGWATLRACARQVARQAEVVADWADATVVAEAVRVEAANDVDGGGRL